MTGDYTSEFQILEQTDGCCLQAWFVGFLKASDETLMEAEVACLHAIPGYYLGCQRGRWALEASPSVLVLLPVICSSGPAPYEGGKLERRTGHFCQNHHCWAPHPLGFRCLRSHLYREAEKSSLSTSKEDMLKAVMMQESLGQHLPFFLRRAALAIWEGNQTVKPSLTGPALLPLLHSYYHQTHCSKWTRPTVQFDNGQTAWNWHTTLRVVLLSLGCMGAWAKIQHLKLNITDLENYILILSWVTLLILSAEERDLPFGVIWGKSFGIPLLSVLGQGSGHCFRSGHS